MNKDAATQTETDPPVPEAEEHQRKVADARKKLAKLDEKRCLVAHLLWVEKSRLYRLEHKDLQEEVDCWNRLRRRNCFPWIETADSSGRSNC